MNALDSSVAIAALATWHAAHEVARVAGDGAWIASHAMLETYSVLTRLPYPHRLEASFVAEALERRFPRDHVLVPSAAMSGAVVARCVAAGIEGGAVYDGLVALTCAEAGATLLTRDARAITTYERLDVAFEFVG